MNIESLIKRPGGTKATFDACKKWPAGAYHFAPDPKNPDGPHLCEVTDEQHIHRFLSISHSFRVHLGDPQAAEFTAKKPEPKPADGSGSVQLPAKDTGGADGTDPVVVHEVRDLTIKELKASIGKYDEATLLAALASEKARTDDPPRVGWIAVVEAHTQKPD